MFGWHIFTNFFIINILILQDLFIYIYNGPYPFIFLLQKLLQKCWKNLNKINKFIYMFSTFLQLSL